MCEELRQRPLDRSPAVAAVAAAGLPENEVGMFVRVIMHRRRPARGLLSNLLDHAPTTTPPAAPPDASAAAFVTRPLLDNIHRSAPPCPKPRGGYCIRWRW